MPEAHDNPAKSCRTCKSEYRSIVSSFCVSTVPGGGFPFGRGKNSTTRLL
jgi:hypothetical protein